MNEKHFSGAVPSIFPWNCESLIMEAPQSAATEDTDQPDEENAANVSGSSKGSEIENLDNIKKFIEAQEKDIRDQIDMDAKQIEPNDNVVNVVDTESCLNANTESIETLVRTLEIDLGKQETVETSVENIEKPNPNVEQHIVENLDDNVARNIEDETLAVASSVMEMILTKTEAKAMETEPMAKDIPKQTIDSGNLKLLKGAIDPVKILLLVCLSIAHQTR